MERQINLQINYGIEEFSLAVAWAAWEYFQEDILSRSDQVAVFIDQLNAETVVNFMSAFILREGLKTFKRGPEFKDIVLCQAREKANLLLTDI